MIYRRRYSGSERSQRQQEAYYLSILTQTKKHIPVVNKKLVSHTYAIIGFSAIAQCIKGKHRTPYKFKVSLA